ncbi:MAG TPA: thiamine diphosphokinase [Bacteroidales bacterium]|jgi:thiamine pyrophosphokinase|nr:thiamine diphosphokinase [Bacteroidales bacterium]HPL06294.1 thiamine diphosphokinase [Bacteroidales bacterium]
MPSTIILANGEFPRKPGLLHLLRQAEHVVCCDGAAEKLLNFGREPSVIVGDMDSLSPSLKELYADRIITIDEQETNDLTKAVNYCERAGYRQIILMGATGIREDHTLGNISLLVDYSLRIEDICMQTNYGRIDVVRHYKQLQSYPGQQISLFAIDPSTIVNAEGLKYPLIDRRLTNWWQGSLNEALGSTFEIRTQKGAVLVYRTD